MPEESKVEQFAAMVHGGADERYRRYVLAELRCAFYKAQLLANEIKRIGYALKGNMIDSELALQWLNEAGALEFLQEGCDEKQDDAGQHAPADGLET